MNGSDYFIGGGDPLYSNGSGYIDYGSIDTSSIAYDNTTGLYYDINSGAYVDPSTGAPLDTSGSSSSIAYDNTTGLYYDINSGAYVDPTTGQPLDTSTTPVTTTYPDGSTLQETSTGSLYYDPNTDTWTTVDYASGLQCSGDSTGNYCCSDGSCSPGWTDPTTGQPAPPPGKTTWGGGGGGSGAGGSIGGGVKPPSGAAAPQPPPRPTIPTIPKPLAPYGTTQAGFFTGSVIPNPGMAQPGTLGTMSTNTWIWIVLGAVVLLAFTGKK